MRLAGAGGPGAGVWFITSQSRVGLRGIAGIFPPVVGIGPLGRIGLVRGIVESVVRISVMRSVARILARRLWKSGSRFARLLFIGHSL